MLSGMSELQETGRTLCWRENASISDAGIVVYTLGDFSGGRNEDGSETRR